MFGGAIAARLLEAAAGLAGERRPLSAATTFTRPAQPGRARISTELATAGRSLAVVRSLLTQEGRTAALQTATFTTQGLPPAEPDPDRPAVTRPAPAPSATGDRGAGGPQVHRRVDWRCATPWGQELHAWIAPRDEAELATTSWLLIASDLLGPAVANRAEQFPFYTATLSLNVEFISAPQGSWLQQRVRGRVAGSDAYGTLDAWDEAGTRVACATQHARLLPAVDADLPYCVTGFGWGREPAQ